MAMLEVKDINVYYGAIHAIKSISLAGEEGKIITLTERPPTFKTTPKSFAHISARRLSTKEEFLWRTKL